MDEISQHICAFSAYIEIYFLLFMKENINYLDLAPSTKQCCILIYVIQGTGDYHLK